MKIFVVQKMPDPRDAAYEEALEHWIAHFVEQTDGRAFVLFTNYRNMQLLEKALAAPPSERRRQSRADWLILAGVMLALVALLVASIVMAILIAGWISKRLMS